MIENRASPMKSSGGISITGIYVGLQTQWPSWFSSVNYGAERPLPPFLTIEVEAWRGAACERPEDGRTEVPKSTRLHCRHTITCQCGEG